MINNFKTPIKNTKHLFKILNISKKTLTKKQKKSLNQRGFVIFTPNKYIMNNLKILNSFIKHNFYALHYSLNSKLNLKNIFCDFLRFWVILRFLEVRLSRVLRFVTSNPRDSPKFGSPKIKEPPSGTTKIGPEIKTSDFKRN